MQQCSDCPGFLPPRVHVCPHCGAQAPADAPRTRSVGPLEAGAFAAALVTLMACYGGAPDCEERIDQDKDGASVCADARPLYPAQTSTGFQPRFSGEDCDDKDPSRRPGFPDPEGDGLDQNCDGADGLAKPMSARPLTSSSAAASAGPMSSATPTTSASAPRSAAPSASGAIAPR